MPGWATIWSLVSNGLALLRKLADIFSTAMAKKAGRDEAKAETLQRNAEQVTKAKEAADEAAKDHLANPDDDKAFDTSFRRD